MLSLIANKTAAAGFNPLHNYTPETNVTTNFPPRKSTLKPESNKGGMYKSNKGECTKSNRGEMYTAITHV